MNVPVDLVLTHNLVFRTAITDAGWQLSDINCNMTS